MTFTNRERKSTLRTVEKANCQTYQRITDIRSDYLNKVSWKIIWDNDTIVLEDLNIKRIMQNHRLTKSVADVSLAKLIRIVKYKAAWYGRTVLQMNRWFLSSKTYNEFSYIKQELKFSNREWVCSRCNVKHDRDLNASKNIKKQGLTLATVGTIGLAWGA
jgi:putative transposase